jgi:hypothetical protein
MKESRLVNLLLAEEARAGWLWQMQRYIEVENFLAAMHAQLEYLYWCDELDRLFPKHCYEYWDLRAVAGG